MEPINNEELNLASGGKLDFPDGPLMPEFNPSKLVDPDGDFSSTTAD